jgi:hypothetical protein
MPLHWKLKEQRQVGDSLSIPPIAYCGVFRNRLDRYAASGQALPVGRSSTRRQPVIPLLLTLPLSSRQQAVRESQPHRRLDDRRY